MSKEKHVEKKSVNAWKLAFIILIIVSSISSIWGYIYFRSMETALNQDVTNEKSLVDQYREAIKKEQLDLAKAKIEVDKAKRVIASIKDKDDLLKRDIELYIDTTHPKVPRVVAKEIAKQIVDISRKHKVSPEVVVGIIKVESAFNPMAVGPKTKYGHARGLMQVMPEWAKKLGLKGQYDFHNIDIGIESGIKVFLIHLEEGKGDISTGLYYYVNKDRKYVANVYAAMGKFVAFRSTIDEESQNVKTDIDNNGDSKKLPADDKKEGKKS